VGTRVNKYDPLAEVMTDKVNAEIPSSFAGVIKEIIAKEGETLPVGAVICTIEVEGEGTETAETKREEAPKAEVPAAPAQAAAPKKPAGERGRYSPAVLRLAQEHNIDLEQVQGTGMGGRITRKDLLKLIESGNIPTPSQTPTAPVQAPVQSVQEAPKAEASVAAAPKQAAAPNVPLQPGDIEIPVTPVR
ncbi:E3 binding domain-containing protein, partial [Brevibacillus sp. MCWH]|uniref:E3 binding domain-containing protein n=1 Tax=Brevibacillus sp. MCWH TaxID=2508871 RepID=UPI001492A35A